MIALLLGPLRPYIIGAAALLALTVAGWTWLLRHDARLRSEWETEQALAVAAAVAAQRAKGDEALRDAEELAAQRARRSVSIREVIRHAPPSACPLPPALTIAADELRRRGADRAGHPAGAGALLPSAARP